MARDDQKSSLRVMRSQCSFPCVVRACARDPHTNDTERRRRGDRGTGSLRDGPSSRVAECTVPRAVSPSRKKGQTHNTQTGLLPKARALSRVSRERATRSAQHKDARDSRSDKRAWAQPSGFCVCLRLPDLLPGVHCASRAVQPRG